MSFRFEYVVRFVAVSMLAASAFAQANGTTWRVSVSSTGGQTNGFSANPRISDDGRYVVFQSAASNLIVGDVNGVQDVFRFDRWARANVLVSATPAGQPGNADSWGAAISADGDKILFGSDATNLIAGDTNGVSDMFVRNMTTGATQRISVSSAGLQANNASWTSSLSADGLFAAFASDATNLVTGDTNNKTDVFVRDLVAGTTTRVSVSTAGVQGNDTSYDPVLSQDGRFVAFTSGAKNLVTNDTNGWEDVFLYDRSIGTQTCLSRAISGATGAGSSLYPSISRDGMKTAFSSYAANLVTGDTNAVEDVFVCDAPTGVITRVSLSSAGAQGNDFSTYPAISGDGRKVIFITNANNLVPGDTNGVYDAVVRDTDTNTTALISQSTAGVIGNNYVYPQPGLSGDARWVVFTSTANNLVAGDTNGVEDVFLRDRDSGVPYLYCTAKVNSKGCTPLMSFAGSASMTDPTPFTLAAAQVLNNKNGLLFYGYTALAQPFQGGWLCVKPPTKRTPVQNSAGNPPPNDCSGHFAFDFNAFIGSGKQPAFHPGLWVYTQYYYRDPADPTSYGLSDAVGFTILP